MCIYKEIYYKVLAQIVYHGSWDRSVNKKVQQGLQIGCHHSDLDTVPKEGVMAERYNDRHVAKIGGSPDGHREGPVSSGKMVKHLFALKSLSCGSPSGNMTAAWAVSEQQCTDDHTAVPGVTAEAGRPHQGQHCADYWLMTLEEAFGSITDSFGQWSTWASDVRINWSFRCKNTLTLRSFGLWVLKKLLFFMWLCL